MNNDETINQMINIPDVLTTTGISTLLILSVVWLFRRLIVTRLSKSVGFEFDEKLEQIKSDLRQEEENLKNNISRNAADVDSLRNSALSGILSIQTSLSKRRIQAVENLWKHVVGLRPAKYTAGMMASIDIGEVNKRISSGRGNDTGKLLGGLHALSSVSGMESLPKDNAEIERPFLSPLAWSLFSAYQAIVLRSCAQLELLKKGLGTEILDDKKIMDLVNAVLPHQLEVIKKFGVDASYYLLDELEKALLQELDNILQGNDYDQKHVERADEIRKKVHELVKNSDELNNQDGV